MICGIWGRKQQMEKEDSRADTAKPFLPAGLPPLSSTLYCSRAVLYVNFGFRSKCFALLKPEPRW